LENGSPIPIECCFMPKSAGDPALEVADFIVNGVGGQARRNLKTAERVREGFPSSLPLGRS
jgi:hypothetical protein